MKKPNKRDAVNLIFSAFIVLALLVCAHFFTQFTNSVSPDSPMLTSIVSIAIFVIFGLMLFYVTRVGEGKIVKRFSPVTLIAMVIIPLYILIASIASGLPFNEEFASSTGNVNIIVALAGVTFGYGIPYSFISGFELAPEDDGLNADKETEILEGGIEADILDDEASDDADENTDEE